MRNRKHLKYFVCCLCVLGLAVCSACNRPFSQKEPTYEILSTGEYDGPGIRLEYGAGTVISIDLVRSLLVIQPDTKLPGFDTMPTQVTLECEYLDLSAVVSGDHVMFYYQKDNISSDRILISTLLNDDQPAS